MRKTNSKLALRYNAKIFSSEEYKGYLYSFPVMPFFFNCKQNYPLVEQLPLPFLHQKDLQNTHLGNGAEGTHSVNIYLERGINVALILHGPQKLSEKGK